MSRCHPIRHPRPVIGPALRNLSALSLASAPRFVGDPGPCWQRPPPYYRQEGIAFLVRSPTPTPCYLRPAGRAACLLGGELVHYVCVTAHAPLDHASLSFDCFLPSGQSTYTSHARPFLLVDKDGHLHLLVAAPPPEVPTAKDTAIDGSLARHLDSPPSSSGHCGQRGISLGHCRSRPGVTPISCFSPTALAAARTSSRCHSC